MREFFLFIASIFFLVALGGCAVHAPISQSVILHGRSGAPASETRVGIGATAFLSPATTWAEEYASQSEIDDLDLINPRRMGGGLYFAYFDSTGRSGLSFTLGFPVAGIDYTFRVKAPIYMTLAASAPGQYSSSILYASSESPIRSTAIGLGYRYQLLMSDGPTPSTITNTDLGVHSIGLDVTYIGIGRKTPGSGTRIGVHGGYIPNLGRFVFSFSFAFGRM